MNELGEFFKGLLGVVFMLIIFAMAVQILTDAGLAPQPGDSLYFVWRTVAHLGWEGLVLLVPGVGAAAYFLFGDSGGL